MIWIALASLTAWAVLLFGRGGFWRIESPPAPPAPAEWPEVVAVIPARDEADGIAATIRSLLTQDYPGRLTVIVVDDSSSDGTADIARAAGSDRLTVLTGDELPRGWTGKVWAMEQGVRLAAEIAPDAAYVLFTDADIAHAPNQLAALVARAEADGLDLASVMVRLNCASLPERALIPAFVFFFRMLYPFRRVADRRSTVAGAAGGVMLARRSAIEGIGGMAALKGALIDDCSFARLIKAQGGRLWLGLAEQTRSLRVYHGWAEPWNMIARSAYDQLDHSPLLLVGTVLAMGLVFVAPPLLALATGLCPAWLAWAAMTFK